MEDKSLDLRSCSLKGNVLDIGYKDYGVIYNLCKRDYKDLDIDYLNGNNKYIKEENYDICVLFFSLKNMWMNLTKEKIITFIHNVLKEDGELYIWDIDKGVKKVFNYNLKVLISENNMKTIKVNDFNVFNDNSKENIIKLITSKFDIIDFDYNDDIFYIRAKKKGC